jgi:hypothetical protein
MVRQISQALFNPYFTMLRQRATSGMVALAHTVHVVSHMIPSFSILPTPFSSFRMHEPAGQVRVIDPEHANELPHLAESHSSHFDGDGHNHNEEGHHGDEQPGLPPAPAAHTDMSPTRKRRKDQPEGEVTEEVSQK